MYVQKMTFQYTKLRGHHLPKLSDNVARGETMVEKKIINFSFFSTSLHIELAVEEDQTIKSSTFSELDVKASYKFILTL